MRCAAAGWFGRRCTLKTIRIPEMGHLLYWARDCARCAPVMSDAGEDGQAPSEHDGDETEAAYVELSPGPTVRQ